MLNDTLGIVRSFHNLSKVEVAAKVGLSRSYISELESGQKKVTLEVLQKYSDAFAIPMSSLLFFDEHKKDNSAVESARIAIGGKVVKMLQWISDISDVRKDDRLK
ncbi:MULTISPECIES: helix-turn-helix domain-containing protein [Brevundimonas]|uniref:Transcriptional regulator with XRE-family HTH domain n=1 Tax=Brevundimonas faecalis TaxID=947378 RepID=A0ABV2R820_9CAUL